MLIIYYSFKCINIYNQINFNTQVKLDILLIFNIMIREIKYSIES